MIAADFTIFEALRERGVPFVIVGGHAVNFHGFIRATEDTDVVWMRSVESEIALHNALSELDARYIGKKLDPATKIERTYPVSLTYIKTHPLMMLFTRCGFLDLFSYIPVFRKRTSRSYSLRASNTTGCVSRPRIGFSK